MRSEEEKGRERKVERSRSRERGERRVCCVCGKRKGKLGQFAVFSVGIRRWSKSKQEKTKKERNELVERERFLQLRHDKEWGEQQQRGEGH